VILIALGSNLAGPAGAPAAQLDAALAALAARGIGVDRRSRWWRSAAWPDPADPPFVNGVAAIRTDLSPSALLAELHAVEVLLGRRRSRPNAPRSIDLDLLDHDGAIMTGDSGGLILPHPRLSARGFVLLPLRDVAPGWRHPVSGLELAALIATLPPQDGTEPLDRQPE
jgi:2-amino-4-hydroxy-6-hydroxymethyldihydropteridine diphosphokinase